ncbi:MAG: hypothetical protein C4567_16910 [Deltaproteobacteria bacterium]|nr:MAG: hypothetical protein C4567_16910 [Deltaproteobacteria bacterium]
MITSRFKNTGPPKIRFATKLTSVKMVKTLPMREAAGGNRHPGLLFVPTIIWIAALIGELIRIIMLLFTIIKIVAFLKVAPNLLHNSAIISFTEKL